MKAIWDNIRALDVLETLPYVRPREYGALGASLGGHNTLFTAAFDERIVVAVSGCGMDSFQHYRGGDITVWANEYYMPKLKEYSLADIPFDFHDVIGLIAPRQCFISAPRQDFFRWDSAAWVVESARAVYSLYGASENLTIEHPDCAHAFPAASRQTAYRRLDTRFEHTPSENETVPLYQIDSFTNQRFAGNPAAVCLLSHWPDDGTLASVARENNLSETAFLVPTEDGFSLRWFTPRTEVPLCGHATLAAAYVVFTSLGWEDRSVSFHTRHSGTLTVTRRDDLLEMDFPARPSKPISAPSGLTEALGVATDDVFSDGRKLMVVLPTESDVRDAAPDFRALEACTEAMGVILTAPGEREDVDFVSRFFAPRCGVPEDPVTGSAHCVLTPYWAERLGKQSLFARQISARGGEVHCQWAGDRVLLSGRARLVVVGTMIL